MNWQTQVYNNSISIVDRLMDGEKFPEPEVKMSERAACLAKSAEKHSHFLFDAYPEGKLDPKVVFILTYHGSSQDVSDRESKIAEIIKDAVDNDFLTSNDTFLSEGNNGRLLYETPTNVHVPGVFPFYVQKNGNGSRNLFAYKKGKWLERVFQYLKCEKIPFYFRDNRDLQDDIHQYGSEVAAALKKLRLEKSYADKFEQAVAKLIDTNITRTIEHFLPAILKHVGHGRVVQVFGLNDYNLGVIPETLKERNISYMAFAPKRIK
jgi:hypothetical protein